MLVCVCFVAMVNLMITFMYHGHCCFCCHGHVYVSWESWSLLLWSLLLWSLLLQSCLRVMVTVVVVIVAMVIGVTVLLSLFLFFLSSLLLRLEQQTTVSAFICDISQHKQ